MTVEDGRPGTVGHGAGIDEKRLRWLCRRGMKELDIMLGRYMDAGYSRADVGERDAFRLLLDQDDPVLWGWLSGAVPVDDLRLEAIVGILRGQR